MTQTIIIWIIILSSLLGWELYTVLDKNPMTDPLTTVTTNNVPWWVTMPFLTWLWIHFAIRYW